MHSSGETVVTAEPLQTQVTPKAHASPRLRLNPMIRLPPPAAQGTAARDLRFGRFWYLIVVVSPPGVGNAAFRG